LLSTLKRDLKMTEEKKLLNAKDVTEFLMISRTTLQTWRKEKKDFPQPFQAGRRLLWKRSEIESYIESTRKPRE
jgi:predicted DNA-binding transcriptional regulator AlpA